MRRGHGHEPDLAPAPLPPDAARDQLRANDQRSSCPVPLELLSALHHAALTRSSARRAELRRDPISGRLRRPRPRTGAAARVRREPVEDELEACPFCAGREDRTPPRDAAAPRQSPWQVRVVPNLYPAFERQEVVDPHARAPALHRRARRRAARARRGGLAERAAAAQTRRLRLPARARERGPRGRGEPAAHALAARLVARPSRPSPAAESVSRCALPEGDAGDRAATASSCSPVGRRGCRTRCSSRPSSPKPDAFDESAARAALRSRPRAVRRCARSSPDARAQPLAARVSGGGTSRSCRASRSSPGSSSAPGSTSTRCRPRRLRAGWPRLPPESSPSNAHPPGSFGRPRWPRRGSAPCPSPA